MIPFRTILALTLLVTLVSAQFDDRMWIVQDSGAGPGQISEVDRAGTLVASYPGPRFGSGGIAKDLFLNQVWVCDDGWINGPGVATGAIRAYRSGVGQVQMISLPGARAIVTLSNGDLAILINESPFTPSRVQLIPWNSQGGVLPPQIPLGQFATTMKAGRDLTLWTLNRLSGTISRLQSGTNIVVTPFVPNTLAEMVLLPDGGVLITHQGTSVVTTLDPSGVLGTLTLSEPPLIAVADGDSSLAVIGMSLTLHRLFITPNGVGGYDVYPTDDFPLPPGNYRSIIPDRRQVLWLEESTGPSLSRYWFGGFSDVTVTPPYPTATQGDPLGIEWATKTNPFADVDGDGVSSYEEVRRGTDLLDGTDVPPMLTVGTVVNGYIPLELSAPGRPFHPVFIVVSLSGAEPSIPLGPDRFTGPYYDLSFFDDVLSSLILRSQQIVQPHFLGMPFLVTDGIGESTSAVDFSAWPGLPGGLAQLYCAAIVWEPTLSGVSATSNTVCFDNTGISCPVP